MGKIQFHCDLSGAATSLSHFGEHTVGGDHAPMVLRADCQAQLRKCPDELGFLHLRFHGLLSDDMGTRRTTSRPFLSTVDSACSICHSWNDEARAIHLGIELPPLAVAAMTLDFAPAKTDGGSQP